MINKTEIKNIAQNLEYCRALSSRIMTAMIEEELSFDDFEYNMQTLASDIDDEYIRLQAIIDSLPDECSKEGE